MELVYLMVLLAAVVATNWRFLRFDRLWDRWTGARGRACRWRPDPRAAPGAGRRFVCAECGASAVAADGRAPTECRRADHSRRG